MEAMTPAGDKSDLITWSVTPRGFAVGYFTDYLPTRCSIQRLSGRSAFRRYVRGPWPAARPDVQ